MSKGTLKNKDRCSAALGMLLNYRSLGVLPDLYALDSDVAQEFLLLCAEADAMGIKLR